MAPNNAWHWLHVYLLSCVDLNVDGCVQKTCCCNNIANCSEIVVGVCVCADMIDISLKPVWPSGCFYPFVFDSYVASSFLIFAICSWLRPLACLLPAQVPPSCFLCPSWHYLDLAVKLFLQSQTSSMESGWVNLETPTWLFCSDTI